jgi:uncharacterized membrane protein YdjX (TVP38/TMEM64 family)
VVFALVLVGLLAWAARGLGISALMTQVVTSLREAGPLVFFGAMAVLPAFGFPLLPFTLTAGPVFGPSLGTGGVIGCAVLAVMINVALSYGLAATVLRPLVRWLVVRLGYRLPEMGASTPWFFITMVRVLPALPFWVQSYGLGLLRVNFLAYMVVSTLVPAGYIAGAVLFGDALFRGRSGAALAAFGLLATVGAAVHFLRRHLNARAAVTSGQ